MRCKYYLRGIGLGILFATIVMTVAYEIHKSEIEVSDTKVIERAEELGMEFPSTTINGSDSLTTEGTEAAEITTETETETETAQAEEENAVTDEEIDDQTDAGTDNGNAETPVSPETPENQEEGAAEQPVTGDATITISSGTTWREIAASLVEQGIITDADDFWNYVYHNANGKALHTGTFTIPAGSDYDTIISVITS